MNQAVVTGGGGALGQAIAHALERPDWKVLAPARSELDVSCPESIHTFFQQKSVDLLVCAAGLTRDALLPRLFEADWDETMKVNFVGARDCARAVLSGMVERNSGHIVFISSHSAIHPPMGQAAYATAKAALLGLMRDLAREFGVSNIRVNSVLPGFLETRMTESVNTKRRDEVRSDHVLGRFNTPAVVGSFIRDLHHDLPHTSGQVFQLDSRLG
jgi:3-oxoacyl-[acyl-carrier protein] reductase